jgi:hypothetical protein
MRRLLSRRLAIIAIAAVLVAGGAVAALAASSSGGSKAGSRPHAASATSVSDTRLAANRTQRAGNRVLGTAASYLGMSLSQLRRELRTGKSLAQIADQTSGKSESGLIAAVEKTKQGKITKASTRLDKRVTAQVKALGGPTALRRIHTLRQYALAYLGITAQQLRSDVAAHKSLAQIAATTAGKSEAGLVEAIVAARKQQLEAIASRGRLSSSELDSRIASLQQRIRAYVGRTPHIASKRLARKSATS